MSNLVFNSVEFNGKLIYKFESRGTKYEVMENSLEEGTYDIWSKRLSEPHLSCYNTLDDMRKRSKALSALADFIEFEPTSIQ